MIGIHNSRGQLRSLLLLTAGLPVSPLPLLLLLYVRFVHLPFYKSHHIYLSTFLLLNVIASASLVSCVFVREEKYPQSIDSWHHLLLLVNWKFSLWLQLLVHHLLAINLMSYGHHRSIYLHIYLYVSYVDGRPEDQEYVKNEIKSKQQQPKSPQPLNETFSIKIDD